MMLAAPGPDNRPMYAAKDISSFYVKRGPKIFPETMRWYINLYIELLIINIC